MSLLSQFMSTQTSSSSSGQPIGSFIPGSFPGNAKYLPCDGVSTITAPVGSRLGEAWPNYATASFSGGSVNQNFTGYFYVVDVAYGNGLYVAAGNCAGSGVTYVLTSTDGLSWTPRGLGAGAIHVTSVSWNGHMFVVCGADQTYGSISIATTNTYTYTSYDGLNWSQASTLSLTNMALGQILWRGEQALALHSIYSAAGQTLYLADKPGSTWVAVGGNPLPTAIWARGVVYRGAFVIASGTSLYYSFNPGSSGAWISWSGIPTNITGLAVAGNTLVITLTSGIITATALGGTFTTATGAPVLTAVASNGTTFVGVHSNGTVYSSLAGATWSVGSQIGNGLMTISNNGLGVMPTFKWTSNGYLLTNTSSNNPQGYSWSSIFRIDSTAASFNTITPAYGPVGLAIGDIEYAPTLGLYVAIVGGGVGTSPDGITWSPRGLQADYPMLPPGSPTCVRWNGSMFVMTTTTNYIFTSADGIEWKPKLLTGLNGTYPDIAYGGGRWIITYNSGGNGAAASSYYTSTDGITWTSQNYDAAFPGVGSTAVAHNGTTWCVVSYTGTSLDVKTSTTGLTGSWTTRASYTGYTCATPINRMLKTRGSLFVFGGFLTNGSTVRTSSDGITWTNRSLGMSNNSTSAVRLANGTNYMIAVPYESDNMSSNYYATSADGITWTQRVFDFGGAFTNASTNANYGTQAFSVATNGTQFIVGTTSGKFVKSADGLTGWSASHPVQRYSTPNTYTNYNGTPYNTAYGNGTLVALSTTYATAQSNTAYVLNSTLGTWTSYPVPVSPGLTTQVVANGIVTYTAVGYGNGMFVALGSNTSGTSKVLTCATSADGTSWVARAMPALSLGIGPNTSIPSGAVFTSVTWTGTQWIAIGPAGVGATSTDGVTWTMTVLPFAAGTGTSGGTQFLADSNISLGVAMSRFHAAWCPIISKLVVVPPNSRGANGVFWSTADGSTWTEIVPPAEFRQLGYTTNASVAIAASSSEIIVAYIATGASSNFPMETVSNASYQNLLTVIRTTDGVNWSAYKISPSTIATSQLMLNWDGANYVLSGGYNAVYISKNGTYWSVRPLPIFSSNCGIAGLTSGLFCCISPSSSTTQLVSFDTNTVLAPLLSTDYSTGSMLTGTPYHTYSLVVG